MNLHIRLLFVPYKIKSFLCYLWVHKTQATWLAAWVLCVLIAKERLCIINYLRRNKPPEMTSFWISFVPS